MDRFSAHIGYLYTELPFTDRISAAAKDGFTAIEHNEPFDVPAAEMRRRLDDLGLSFSQLSSGMGDVGKGEKGLAALCGREAEFRSDFLRALEYAQVIGCPLINPMAGTPRGGMLDASETYYANIGWAIEACVGSDVTVLVEPITLAGYYLGSLRDAVSLQERFGGRFKLLLDTFHAANMQIDPVAWIDDHVERIGHVHIAAQSALNMCRLAQPEKASLFSRHGSVQPSRLRLHRFTQERVHDNHHLHQSHKRDRYPQF